MSPQRFPISFADGNVALAVRAGPGTELAPAVRGMGLTTGVPTIVVVAAGTRPAQVGRLRPLLEKVVARVADEVTATVLDDGSPAGVPGLLGLVRTEKKAAFPLLGVAAGHRDDTHGDDLDPGHTHFVLVAAGRPEEVPAWVAAVADAVAGGNRSVALVLGGGEPAWLDVREHVRAGRLVMAVSHSGGVADHLAAALAGRPADDRARALAGSGAVCAVDPGRGAASVAGELRTALSRPDQLGPAPAG